MKDKNVAAILALFLGFAGIHKFYLGKIGAGVLYMVFAFTTIPALLGVIDFFILALMDNDEFNRRYNGSHALGAGPVVVNMLPPGHVPPPPGWMPPGYSPYGPVMYGTPRPAPPSYPPNYPQARPMGPRNAEELASQLEKLNELRISGLLTEEEFAAQKARLLNSM